MQNPSAQFAGTPIRYELDGVADDLLTAGLGPEGLRGSPPGFADPTRPTALELRRRAIYMNYRGLVDVTVDGGFGTLFGPSSHALVAGVEYLFALRMPDGSAITTTALLQIPKGFDPGNPCLIAVASSGSRGIYGALATAGEWGLRHNCAVVHSDKGTGTGICDADRERGIRIDGTLTGRDDPLLTFPPSHAAIAALKKSRSHSVVFKHAHSGLNVEAHWGEYLLQAIDAAFQLLNAEYPHLKRALTPSNTLVVASGISNGGGAVLQALERDHAGWIRGAVVSEPNAPVTGLTQGLSIESAGCTYTRLGASLYDYATEHLLLQPCALLAEAKRSVPVRDSIGAVRASLEQWCRELGDLGVVPRGEPGVQSENARAQLMQSGVLEDALRIGHLNVTASVWTAIVATYASAYARLAPDELPCGISFAAMDANGTPRALTDEELARAFSDSNGLAPTAGVSLVAPGAAGQLQIVNHGSARLAAGLRALHTGQLPNCQPNTGTPDMAEVASIAQRLAAGEREITLTARLSGRPLIILQGRADALIPVNHGARAYYAVNQSQDRARTEVRYYEIEHGQHFDAFLALPDLAARYVPLQPYLLQAMDLMAARLRSGTALPPSQVVRSIPRGVAGDKVPALAAGNLGAICAKPGADAIVFDGYTLRVP